MYQTCISRLNRAANLGKYVADLPFGDGNYQRIHFCPDSERTKDFPSSTLPRHNESESVHDIAHANFTFRSYDLFTVLSVDV